MLKKEGKLRKTFMKATIGQKKQPVNTDCLLLIVAVPGLEPRLREPESRVLPLHHTAEKKCCPTETRTQSNRTKIWCATITPWGNQPIRLV